MTHFSFMFVSRYRDKVSVGEPAEGSFTHFTFITVRGSRHKVSVDDAETEAGERSSSFQRTFRTLHWEGLDPPNVRPDPM